ncbi:MAG: hypothetical protein HND48_06025 [Chloroflexi bacterium]|nr:hypothetical protein [Chloroflexota bacterium]
MEKASAAFSDMAMFFSYQAPNVLILAVVTVGSGWVLLRLFGDIDRVRPVHSRRDCAARGRSDAGVVGVQRRQ